MPTTYGTPCRTRYSTTIWAPDRRRVAVSEAVTAWGRGRSMRPSSRPRRLRCNRLRAEAERSMRGSAVQRRTSRRSREPTMDTMTRSPLARTVAETATDIWNDSCAVDELEYAIANGATGATANPTIVHDVWKKDPAHWRKRVRTLAVEHPTW